MLTIQVFDPAMCCPSGVCGPGVDPALARFAADVAWLKSQGICVDRFNLSQNPKAFVSSEVVRRTLQSEGTECLPLVVVGLEVKSRGSYPTRPQLAEWAGIEARARTA